MRPTSIIFLILSLVLIIGGVAICFTASNIAQADGVMLFNQTTDLNDNLLFSSDITNLGINKFEIQVSDCDVHIIGGSETSYVELLNFPEGLYSFHVSSKIVTLNETPNVLDMLKFWENGFQFKGMRYFARVDLFSQQEEKRKVVNIYLNDAEDIKIVDVSVVSGVITVDSLLHQSDYTLTVNDGSISMQNSTTNAHVVLKGENCDVSLENSSFSNVAISLQKGHISTQKTAFTSFDAAIQTGNIDIESEFSLERFLTHLQAPDGNIVINGENFLGEFRSGSNVVEKLQLRTEHGDIRFQQIDYSK